VQTVQNESGARPRVHQSLYTWAALACAVIAVTGFARTYYVKAFFGSPPLPALLHIHGLIMSAWRLLFLAQTYLVATHRLRVHRSLGIAGAVLAILVVAIGTYATVAATAREVQAHVIRQFHFLFGLNLMNLLLFAIFVILGLAFRTRPEFHKRLMLMATLTLLAPAVARIVLLFTHAPLIQIVTFDLCILLFVAADTVWHRRLHPALGWSAALVIGSFHLTMLMIMADWWLPFVARVFA
jgi:hypothetical protein